MLTAMKAACWLAASKTRLSHVLGKKHEETTEIAQVKVQEDLCLQRVLECYKPPQMLLKIKYILKLANQIL